MWIFHAEGPFLPLSPRLCSENPSCILSGRDLPPPATQAQEGEATLGCPQGPGLSEPYLSLWNEKLGCLQSQTSEPLAHIKPVLFLDKEGVLYYEDSTKKNIVCVTETYES